jgi:hypothetical protein
MSEHFCTYFDHRYAAKGLAMWRSLKKQCAPATLHVLCLDQACLEILTSLNLPDVRLYSLNALEDSDPDLIKARGNRSLVEYYFTLTPCLPLYIFRGHSQIARLTYVDADLFFLQDPQPILDEIGDSAVGLVEHRFSEDLADRARFGRFNVGWLTFRNDPIAFTCLERWREQCLEWCYDRLEAGRFAEQKYLDDWPDRYPRIAIIQHKGANVAPWNLNRFVVSLHDKEPTVDGQPILFVHAHGFEPRSPGRPRELNLEGYGVVETPILLGSIFEPYEEALIEAISEIATPLALVLLSDYKARHTAGVLETLKSHLAASEADRAARLEAIHGLQGRLSNSEGDRAARLDVIHRLQNDLANSERHRIGQSNLIPTLQRQLAHCEEDRAARLDVIHTLQNQLSDSEGDRAARLDLIHTLQNQLSDSEGDRAARLDLIHTLQNQLSDSEGDRAARLDLIHTLQNQLSNSEGDRAARLDVIHALQNQLSNCEGDRAARLDVIHTLQNQLSDSEGDRAARLDEIHRLENELANSERDRTAQLDVIHALESQVAASEADRMAQLEMVDTLRNRLVSADTNSDQLRTEVDQALSRIHMMEISRSWRWTRPARRMAGLLGGSDRGP